MFFEDEELGMVVPEDDNDIEDYPDTEEEKEKGMYNSLDDEDDEEDYEDEDEDEDYNPLDDEEATETNLFDEEDEDDEVEEEEVEEEETTFDPLDEDEEDTFEENESEEEDQTLLTEEEEDEPVSITEPKLSVDSIEEFMNLDRSKYTIQHGNVLFKELVVKKTMNDTRKDTKAGLVKSIQEVGILTPIHVMITKEYDSYLREQKDTTYEFQGPKYILLDGYRRVYNGIKVGLDGCYATIWNFSDKDYGEDFSLILSAILNKNQKHSINETWELIQKIQKSIPVANRTLDSLLQLENGDTNKLAEIMTCEYPDVIDSVVTGKKTISQGYNALKKLWDEEDQGSRDDKIGVSDFDKEHKMVDTENNGGEAEDEEETFEPRKVLSDDEVSEILGMTDKYSDDDLMEAYDGMLKEPPVEVQDTKHRHPLSKDIKAETLRRDNYKCICCGAGEGLPLKYALAILQSHHIISVGNGGPDTKENIATVCPNCHTLIHTLLWADGVFSKADFDALPAKEKDRMRKILKYASMDYQAAKKRGKTSKDIKEDNKHHSTFKMPGTDLAENKKALEDAGISVDSTPVATTDKTELESIDQNIVE